LLEWICFFVEGSLCAVTTLARLGSSVFGSDVVGACPRRCPSHTSRRKVRRCCCQGPEVLLYRQYKGGCVCHTIGQAVLLDWVPPFLAVTLWEHAHAVVPRTLYGERFAAVAVKVQRYYFTASRRVDACMHARLHVRLHGTICSVSTVFSGVFTVEVTRKASDHGQ
jgi:hypothetical protein